MVESNRLFGYDLSKWYITKWDGWWMVCPPSDGTTGWAAKGRLFTTGAEALDAFNKGAR